MREIEIKATLDQRSTIVAALEAQEVVLSEPITQHDVVWGRVGVNGGDDNTAPWLRIRSETREGVTRHLFTLKRSVTNQLDSIEHETEVSDPSELKRIIEQLGFELYSDLTKTRQKAHIGKIEICLDTVDELGDFIEAEKLTDDDADYQPIVDELWMVLEGIGVHRHDEVTDGYDVLMNKKLGKE